MKTIIGAVLSQEEKLKEGLSVYLNIYVNKDIALSLHVRMKLVQLGLICKDPGQLGNGAHVLGLDVHEEQGTLQWRHGTAVPEVLDILTRHAVFSLCGRFRHLPVCGWLRMAASTIKHRASIVTKCWDYETTDTFLVCMMTETRAKGKVVFLYITALHVRQCLALFLLEYGRPSFSWLNSHSLSQIVYHKNNLKNMVETYSCRC